MPTENRALTTLILRYYTFLTVELGSKGPPLPASEEEFHLLDHPGTQALQLHQIKKGGAIADPAFRFCGVEAYQPRFLRYPKSPSPRRPEPMRRTLGGTGTC